MKPGASGSVLPRPVNSALPVLIFMLLFRVSRLEVLPKMQRTRFLMLPFFVSALFAVPAIGQDPPPPPEPKSAAAEAKPAPCPRLAVKSPTPMFVREGGPVTFIAELAGGDPAVTPNILWSVTAGMIKDGQGTKRIDVDSTGAGATRQISAELWVGGYAPECGNTANAVVRVAPPAAVIDEFGELPPDQESQRIAAAAASMGETNDKLFIIVYAGRTSVRGYTSATLKRALTELAKTEIEPTRIRTVDGGFREQPGFELWLVPEGAEPPRPTPTIDRREIVYPKATPVRKKP